jgi:hypothetical protein
MTMAKPQKSHQHAPQPIVFAYHPHITPQIPRQNVKNLHIAS